LFKNCSISSKYGSFTDNANFDFRLYNHQENCSYEDPKFVNAALGSEDIRLQSSSPLIGGIAGNSSEEKLIKQAEGENKSYIFFDPNASGTGDGLSLVNACTDLLRAVDLSDSGGYVFVADMDFSFNGTFTVLKPIIFQALNPGKATWRQVASNGIFYLYPAASQQSIWRSAVVDEGNSYTSDTFKIHTSNLPNREGSVLGFKILDSFNDPVEIINHTYVDSWHYITLEREADLSAHMVGNQYMHIHNASSSDYGFRDMNLIDFNTDNNANGSGITVMTLSYGFGPLPLGTFIFERNKLLQNSNSSIVSNSKTGICLRNGGAFTPKFLVKSNSFSQTNYRDNITNYVKPIFITSTYIASNGIVENNSFYYNHNLDAAGYIHLGGTQPESFKNNLFVYVNSENPNQTSTQSYDINNINGNYFYNAPNIAANSLNVMPFIDPEGGDFRIRPNSNIIGA
jgi:hypothetical protein